MQTVNVPGRSPSSMSVKQRLPKLNSDCHYNPKFQHRCNRIRGMDSTIRSNQLATTTCNDYPTFHLVLSLLLQKWTGTDLYFMFSNFLLLFILYLVHITDIRLCPVLRRSQVPTTAITNSLCCFSLVHPLKTTMTPLIRARLLPLPSPFNSFFTNHLTVRCQRQVELLTALSKQLYA
jgi:hypothetical protein